MAEEGKKISFGFSKSIKKSALKNVPAPEQKKVDYIECLDEKSIKIVGGEEKKDEPLVIPMLGSKTWHDRIINKVDADIYEPKTIETVVKTEPTDSIEIKKEPIDGLPNGNVPKDNNVTPMEVTEIKKEPDTNEPVSLEEQAAREIIADLNSKDEKSKAQVFTVPINEGDNLRGKEESTLEDYENIPIDAFGEAMLRGMGWKPGKGIGKNEKVIAPVIPELRPKGMGLGADKVTIQKALGKLKNQQNEHLKLAKNSYIRITDGKHSGRYATVIALDDDTPRVFIKLAIGDEVLSISEYSVVPVTSSEFVEKSKILNVKTYEEYKEKEGQKEKVKRSPHSSEDSTEEDHKSKRNEKSKKNSKKKRHQSSDDSSPDRNSRRKRHSSSASEEEHKPKKSKKKRHHSSDDSSPDRKSRRKRSTSSSSEEDQKPKKSKKSKKHKSRDSSSERSSRKNRKKDKEREKSRHKKSDYSDPSERARYRERKRSRSRSRSHSPKSRRKGRSRSRSPRR